MRSLAAVVCLALAQVAVASPLVAGRVAMVARGDLPASVISDGTADRRALVTVRIGGGARTLSMLGFDARPLSPTIAAVYATPDELRRLLVNPNVEAIEARRILRPLLDQSAPAVRAPQARLATGFDGSGVLVAVIDTGVDYRHADLRNADGTTRVAALLDVSSPRALHPELPDYNGAAVWLRDDIDSVLTAEAAGATPVVSIAEADIYGHGTHVAGIAVSNGLATGAGLPAGRYVGIAPGADLVVAKATHGTSTFTEADVLTGCRFVLDEAAREGRPIVVNVSLGGDGGAHDGSSNFETALDELFPADASGRALVVAAGNGGELDSHAGGWSLDDTLDVPFAVAASSGDAPLSLELYYTGSLSIEVVSPSGYTLGPVAPGQSSRGTSEQIAIDNGTSTPAPSVRRAATVAIGGNGSAPVSGTWILRLGGQAARWDAWIVDDVDAVAASQFLGSIVEDDRLSMPATSHDAIVAGSFVTRNSWTTFAGEHVMRTADVGGPSTFSASGPTSDGRFAPDVVAPGEYVLSALSADAPPTSTTSIFNVGAVDPDYAIADDGVHGALRGTSQAAPHVSGAVALLLQANPALTARQLRELLRASANDDARGYTPVAGFGKLDVLNALTLLTSPSPAAAVSADTSSVSVSRDLVAPGANTTIVSVTPRARDGTPLGAHHDVLIASSAGSPAGPVIDAGSGRYERTFVADAPRGTVAVISASVDGVTLTHQPRVYFVLSRAEIGQPFAAGGGCSFAPTTTIPIGAIGFALFVAAIKSRRRRLRRNLRA
jgi:subtilisin family serine protease